MHVLSIMQIANPSAGTSGRSKKRPLGKDNIVLTPSGSGSDQPTVSQGHNIAGITTLSKVPFAFC